MAVRIHADKADRSDGGHGVGCSVTERLATRAGIPGTRRLVDAGSFHRSQEVCWALVFEGMDCLGGTMQCGFDGRWPVQAHRQLVFVSRLNGVHGSAVACRDARQNSG